MNISYETKQIVYRAEDGRCENCKRPMHFRVAFFARVDQTKEDYSADNLHLLCFDCKKRKVDFLHKIETIESSVVESVQQILGIEKKSWTIKWIKDHLLEHGVFWMFRNGDRIYWLPGIGKFTIQKEPVISHIPNTRIPYYTYVGIITDFQPDEEGRFLYKSQSQTRRLPHPRRKIERSINNPVELIQRNVKHGLSIDYTTDTSILPQGNITMILRGGASVRKIPRELAVRAVDNGVSKIVAEYPSVIINEQKLPGFLRDVSKRKKKRKKRRKRKNSYRRLRKRILERDQYTCFYCGNYGNTVDHIVPKSKGGKSNEENCVCCCADCNHLKNDLSAEEFVKLIAKQKTV